MSEAVSSGHGTTRQRILELLEQGEATAEDLSKLVGIPEKLVPGHLEHIARTVRASGRKLEIVPAECLDCGFAFRDRSRAKRPSRCPKCQGGRLTRPRFRIA